jgi:hypothetical protein
VPLILHWGGDRHGQVADVPDRLLASGEFVYDGRDGWTGVYEPSWPPQTNQTEQGPAEIWIVRE